MIFNMTIGGSGDFIKGITIATAPTKTTYKAGESLDLTGMVVNALWSDGEITDITANITTVPASGAALYESTSSVVINYNGDEQNMDYTISQPVSVTRTLSGLTVTSPTKTSYEYGDALDLSGCVATAQFNSGATEVVAATYSLANGTALKTLGDNTIVVSYTENGVTKKASVVVSVSYSVYGVEWDGTSTTRLSRTDASAGFVDPVPYVSGATSYSSPFDNIAPWSGMVRSTNAAAGEVVAIPKFYYKWTKTGTVLKLQISAGAQDGFNVSPAHQSRGDGSGERDVVYVGRYHSNSSYKSATGNAPLVNVTMASARTSIHNLGSTIWQYDFAMRCTIQMLYLVEFANWNSQNVIGYGCGNNSGVENMGASDTMPYHTGTMQSARTTYGVGTQYRYIEGLWDNAYDWLDGVYYDSNGMNVNMKPSTYSNTSGGTSVGTPAGGWPSEFSIPNVSGLDWALYPTVSNGSGSTYISDGWGFNASNACLCSGGCYGQYQYRGLWCVDYNSSGGASSNVGCRLQILP